MLTACDCLGPCFDGPNAVVYPDGVWYAGLAPDDAAAIADHLIDGRVHAEKVSDRPGADTESGAEASSLPKIRNHGGDGHGNDGQR
jgi:(2Fe-2S) ferredoxin